MTKLPPKFVAPKYNAIIKDIMVKFHSVNKEYWDSKPIEERKCHYIDIQETWLDRMLKGEGFTNDDCY